MTAAIHTWKGVSCLLRTIGAVLVVLGISSGFGSGVALLDRARFGRGIMFADVEFLALLAVVCGVPGVLALVVGGKLAKR